MAVCRVWVFLTSKITKEKAKELSGRSLENEADGDGRDEVNG